MEISVSIPFKRESVSKAVVDFHKAVIEAFRFPSNGKAYPKRSFAATYGCDLKRCVSIPFKRESVSKAGYNVAKAMNHWMFRFPSNGKAYPKPHRESVSKEFNGIWYEVHWTDIMFQFPSNGKVYPKSTGWTLRPAPA